MGIAKLRPLLYCVIPYQAFEAAGFERDLPKNEMKGTMRDHFFQFTNTLREHLNHTIQVPIQAPIRAVRMVGVGH